MSKKQIIQGVLTILAAAIAAALSFFFASCTTSSHLELKHSQDSLVIRKDASGSVSHTAVAFPLHREFNYVYLKF
jgi:hypothetical protein